MAEHGDIAGFRVGPPGLGLEAGTAGADLLSRLLRATDPDTGEALSDDDIREISF